jgi:SHS2 domain-containing protein
MKTFKVLPHTADVRLWIEADSPEELFSSALEGMAGLIKESQTELQEGKRVEDSIKLEAPDVTALLIDFLSSVLTLTHERKAVFTEVSFDELNETSLKCTIKGFETDGFDDDIKAVTYHEANVRKNIAGKFETMIVFDI